MLKLKSYIQIGDYGFNYLVNVNISQSIDTLTDTCTISIPRKLKWQDKEIAMGDDPLLKRKDPVTIFLGYGESLKQQFKGYLKEIKSGVPVTIECEDMMFMLKKNDITKSYSKVTLRQLLTDILPSDIQFVVPEGDKEINLGAFRITKASISKVLEELKTKYGLYSYFRNIEVNGTIVSKLYSGLAYWTDNRKEHKFIFGNNIFNGHSLVYRKAEDINLKVKAISMMPNNTKVELEVGDSDGELRTVYQYNVTKAELKIFATQQLEKLKYTGYRGTFTTFGEPSVEKGDIADITGDKYNPSGKYLIKSVKKESGTGGYRQTIELDVQV